MERAGSGYCYPSNSCWAGLCSADDAGSRDCAQIADPDRDRALRICTPDGHLAEGENALCSPSPYPSWPLCRRKTVEEADFWQRRPLRSQVTPASGAVVLGGLETTEQIPAAPTADPHSLKRERYLP